MATRANVRNQNESGRSMGNENKTRKWFSATESRMNMGDRWERENVFAHSFSSLQKEDRIRLLLFFYSQIVTFRKTWHHSPLRRPDYSQWKSVS